METIKAQAECDQGRTRCCSGPATRMRVSRASLPRPREPAAELGVRPPPFGVTEGRMSEGSGPPRPAEVPAGRAPRVEAGRRTPGAAPGRASTRGAEGLVAAAEPGS